MASRIAAKSINSGTPEESGQAEAMLRKIDILPLQVLIEAVIAEVTLNDNLRYGTQFFFKSHNVNIATSNFSGNVVTPLAATPLLAQFPGLVGGGHDHWHLGLRRACQTRRHSRSFRMRARRSRRPVARPPPDRDLFSGP